MKYYYRNDTQNVWPLLLWVDRYKRQVGGWGSCHQK